MFKVEFITDDGTRRTRVLCDSSLDLAEHNIRLNNRRLLDVVDLFRADYAKVFWRGNRRNILSFDVTRAENFSGKAFADAEEAMAFALDQEAELDGVGYVRFAMTSRMRSTVRWLDNAAIEVTDLNEVIGLAHKYTYTINAGAILKQQPT
jgi:hypothetical protein